MNLGTKLFLIDFDGQTTGPFGWTIVREWAALSLLQPSSFVLIEGGEDWAPLSDYPELSAGPNGETGFGCVRQWLESHPRRDQEPTDEQRLHLEKLRCPVDITSADAAICERVISQLAEHLPDRTDDAIKAYLEARTKEREQARHARHDSHHLAPTPKQLARLRTADIPIEPGLTKARAEALLHPPTEDQVWRLTFYQLPISPELTSEDAKQLIASYRREHPESEPAYQAWKAG
jgi:hypothetical protein